MASIINVNVNTFSQLQVKNGPEILQSQLNDTCYLQDYLIIVYLAMMVSLVSYFLSVVTTSDNLT